MKNSMSDMKITFHVKAGEVLGKGIFAGRWHLSDDWGIKNGLRGTPKLMQYALLWQDLAEPGLAPGVSYWDNQMTRLVSKSSQ
jgi:hypothetical protein